MLSECESLVYGFLRIQISHEKIFSLIWTIFARALFFDIGFPPGVSSFGLKIILKSHPSIMFLLWIFCTFSKMLSRFDHFSLSEFY